MSAERRKRILWSALVGVTLLLALLVAALGVLLYHAAGPRWAIEWLRSNTSLVIEVDQLEGRLAGPLRVRGLRIQERRFALQADEIDLTWQPAALLHGELHLLSVALNGAKLQLPSEASAGASSPRSGFEGIVLPLALRLERLELTDVEIERPSIDRSLRIEHLVLAAQGRGEKLELKRLTLVTPWLELEAQGGLGLSSQLPVDLTLAWRYSLPQRPSLHGAGKVEGNLRQLRVEQTLSGALAGHLRADLNDLTGAFNWEASAKLQENELGAWLNDFPLRLNGGELRSRGSPDRIALQASLELAQPEYGEASLTLEGVFEAGRFDAEKLQILTPAGSRLQGSGHYIPDADLGRFDLDLAWRDLRWPLRGDTLLGESAQGSARLTGAPAAFDYTLSMGLQIPGEPSAKVEAQGSGDLQGIRLKEFLVEVEPGRLKGRGEVAWQPRFSWQLWFEGQEIDPSRWVSELPGRLELTAESRGRRDETGMSAEFRLQQLRGRVREFPVTAQGEARWARQVLTLDRLSLTSASNRIEMEGQVGERLDLAWRVKAPELAALWPGLEGKLEGDGRLEGSRRAPRLLAQLKGDGLVLKEKRVAALRLNADLALSGNRGVDLNLQASDIELPAGEWRSLDLQLTGSLPAHRLTLGLTGDEVPQLRLEAAAGWSDESLWRGRLESLELTLPQQPAWRLDKAAGFALGLNSQRLDELCLAEGEANLCGSFVQAPATGWRATLKAHAFPLSMLGSRLPEGLRIAGSGELQAQMAAQAGGHTQGSWRLRLPQGRLGFDLASEVESIDFAGSELEGGIDAEGARMRWDLPLAGLGAVRGEMTLSGFDPSVPDIGEQALAGHLSLSLQDLSRLSSILPRLQNAKGEIAGDFTLAGNLSRPRLLGSAELREGGLDIPELGLELREIALQMNAPSLDQIVLEGGLRSGQGRLRLKGRVDLDVSAGFPAHLQISGSELTVANLPEAEIQVSPDLTLERDPQGTRLKGRLEIPFARLRPRKLPASAVTVSPDLVVVGGDEPQRRAFDPRIESELRVVLGDRVSFDGFGLRGRLTGSLLLVDEAKRPVIGRGRIGISEGTYRAYGQDLTIERGYALYVDSPVDNPGLNVRAVREIEEVTAGVLVSGTLKSPKVDLFSSPAMDDNDVISYLLTGRPAGAGGGESVGIAAALKVTGVGTVANELARQFGLDELRIDAGSKLEEASVVAGTYLSPRLYLQYINELASQETKLRMRYDINKRLQLEAETGKTQAGDLYYIFDR